MAYYVVFDVGGTRTKHGLMDQDGELVTSGDYETNCRQLEPFLEAMADVVKQYQRTSDVSGIAISLQALWTVKQVIQNLQEPSSP